MSVKVSVVVPIYKVEKYLNRCIDSILSQTYKNIEVILVNDGSPDRCGSIAEEYAATDPRIKVIHKENGGLSDARNAGMQYVTGNYTMFVDSDDWLEVNAIELLITTCKRHKADVVQSDFYYAYKDYLLYDKRFHHRGFEPVILNNQKLMYELVKNDKVKNFAWGKLYKTDLIKDIPFTKGVLFEDVFWAHIVMQRVQVYAILNEPLYYYLQREDSIVSSYSPRNLDILTGLKERHQFLENHYEHLTSESYKLILKTCFIHYNLLTMNWKQDKSRIHRRQIQTYIKKQYKEFLYAVLDERNLKYQLKLFAISPFLYYLFHLNTKILRWLKVLPSSNGLERITFRGNGG
jgi:glycosyltransferase involved in cell wall biosynthesis